ncbi:16S rRNA (adenine(1518)-N(6)/adenine(1519)-N(6))-dimethyltransferase RsmA [Lacticaseibacillus saniviri]|uniref:Ribosomal RNA small subunit methyltransferase A n=1 Tax=Lacticaseibacillus saniviri JCM 17471 = DSM 24301 TaxID=1293598 RepID=A0A0R2MZC8_9LACO|nr:16S rRNA (adenine(1518)-N(6)/adenine(1519)-N(6))-dimethyltransferase RsmA [Lacticaseibacillus saniviri]KRO18935.1 16S ribosomal RNA methyltransferase KsgA Dim1 family protein [Lacticaseibacillus saniviri JCM 17471 = DSM 24301]MCG4280953.1 16S rRNA (adenine(1518)-N(6)/adenine(1519)-N(6))-dimethyltransferase RsmA [Lacticaseibacillus saniviri]
MAEQPRIATPSETNAILKRHGFKLKKSLGQNFLTNPAILSRIVAAGDVGPDDDVIEIGPGIGALTQYLAEAAHQVLALEIDERLIPVLAETLAPYPNATVVEADVLQADLATLIRDHFDGEHTLKVVANLPYYITTPILMHLIEAHLPIASYVVMMQKEVADRLVAEPNSKDYGSLSIGVQQTMDVAVAFEVKRTSFVPAPNVDSAIIKLTTREEPRAQVSDQEAFDKLVRGSFKARRKTLWNNLQNLYGKEPEIKERLTKALDAATIKPSQRAEQLSISDFARLTEALLVEGFK